MRRDPLDDLRMTATPRQPDPGFVTALERRIRRSLAPFLDKGGDDLTQTTTNPLLRHGHLSYIEVPAVDAERSAAFYEGVFGWTIRSRDRNRSQFNDPNGDIIGAFDAGLRPTEEGGVQLFLSVDDVAATLERIVAHGGSVVREPYPEGALTVATFRDPAGNLMGVWHNPEDSSGVAQPDMLMGLNSRDAHGEIRWLTEVLGFQLVALFEEQDGRVAYSQLRWKSAAVTVSSRGDAPRLPQTGPVSVALTVSDEAEVDEHHSRAIDAGAEVLLPPEATYYGGYSFTVRDPEGNLWHVGKPFLDTEQARSLPQRKL